METTFFQIEFFSGWAKIIALLPFILFGLRFLFFLLGISSNFLIYRNHSKDYFSSSPNIKNTLPSVSVIIPARKEEENIKAETVISIVSYQAYEQSSHQIMAERKIIKTIPYVIRLILMIVRFMFKHMING